MHNSITKNTNKKRMSGNYASVFVDGITYRFGQDHAPLAYPEFFDVAINNYCTVGCSYCYPSASKTGKQYENVVIRLKELFEAVPLDLRPYQIALGGEGEATQHPEYLEVMKMFNDLGIVPNTTTSGINLTEQVLEVMNLYSFGTAISLHPHIKKVWLKAIDKLIQNNIPAKAHIVVSDSSSVVYFWNCFNELKEKVEHFVLLPYMGNRNGKEKALFLDEWAVNYRKLSKEQKDKIVFGANAGQWLANNLDIQNKLSVYPLHHYSKYLIMDNPIRFYNDSHQLVEVPNPYSQLT